MKKNIISIFLLFTCMLLIVAGSSIKLSSNEKSVVREIGVEYKTHEEQLSLILDSFDSYNSDFSNNHLTFNSEKLVSVEENDNFVYLSDKKHDELTQKISTDYDLEKNVFTLTLSYYDGGTLVETSTEETIPVYDEEKDDAYNIACEAGLNPRTPYEMPEFEYGFYHYHSIATALVKIKSGMLENRNPHSFFCL